MAYCTKCGKELVGGVCPVCTAAGAPAGTPVGAAAGAPVGTPMGAPAGAAMPAYGGASFEGYLMNPKEKIVCILGNSYMQSFLAGGIFQKGFSVVSDKRVYFRGSVYEQTGNSLRKQKVTKAVNIRDVTGVSVTTIFPLNHIIAGAILFLTGIIAGIAAGGGPGVLIFFLGLILAGVNALMFFMKYKTLLRIEYAGGSIGFEIKWFSQEESLTYQRSLFLAKDKILDDK